MSTEKVEDPHVENVPAEGFHVDPVIEKRLVRKLDWNLVPLVVLLCKCRILPQARKADKKCGESLRFQTLFRSWIEQT